ncbi:MAG: twin-arginine translocase TatA/TatE family subunit [Bacteroidales bacterium]|jgi:TatA/E family protein of Tat protein translocase|nr:twin-arginine translocase TatA/TatE family subunit [Bacteroidales bacterium]
MLAVILFISGGEIFIILLAILLCFGAEKIPEFARMMGKGVREFRKATDDIKRELNNSTSDIKKDIQAIGNDVSGTLNKAIAEPVQKTTDETVAALEDYSNSMDDYYYNNKDYNNASVDEYAPASGTGDASTPQA